jgi:tight adherence protein B
MADAMDRMTAGLQSGSGVRECLDLIRSQRRKPISGEFHELLSLIEMGVPAPAAFKQWSRPLDSKIITIFALGMAAKWDIGGNYSVMLGNLSGRIRELIRLQRRVQTLTAEAMLTAVLALTLPYGLAAMAVLRDPTHLDILWESPSGPRALVFVIFLQGLAIFWMRRMIRAIFKGT